MTAVRAARWWHALTALAAGFGVGVQLLLICLGVSVLNADEPSSLAVRLWRFFSYFTILTNLVVLAIAVTLARRVTRDGPLWRVVRLSSLTGIVVTGVVHWFLLRPLSVLSGWSYGTDKVLHVMVPAMVLVGWLAFGPRRRVTGKVLLASVIPPVAWLGYTLVVGAFFGWYPYPFLNVDELGGGQVAVVCIALTAVVFALASVIWWGDRVLPRAPRPVARYEVSRPQT